MARCSDRVRPVVARCGTIRVVPGYRRFQSAVPNRSGRHPGFFALLRGLAVGGALSDADRQWWEQAVTRSYALHVEPTAVDPHCYDHPGARSWFRDTATDLLALAADGCAVLDRYDVPWVELRTTHPGHVAYRDDVQVVAIPFGYPSDWRLPRAPAH